MQIKAFFIGPMHFKEHRQYWKAINCSSGTDGSRVDGFDLETKMLLISDRLEAPQTTLSRFMLPNSFRVLNLEQLAEAKIPASVAVFDVAIDTELKIRRIKELLQSMRDRSTASVFILRDDTNREIRQVTALGASSYMLSTTEPKLIFERIRKLLGLSPSRSDRLASSEVLSSVFAVGDVLELVDQVTKSAGIVEPGLVGEAATVLIGISEKNGIETLAECVLSYHNQTFRHSLLVSALTASFASRLGLSPEQRRIATEGALVHDIGKSLIPTSILDKPGKLTSAEMALVAMHPVFGYEYLVKRGGFSEAVLSIVRHHHEYLDGSGYPDCLKGTEIPHLVRLVTICDIYAALVEPRSYKRANPPLLAYTILQGMKNKLDTDLLASFVPIARRHDDWHQREQRQSPAPVTATGYRS